VFPLSDFLSKQIESRQRAWNEAKELLDFAAGENRDLTAEEREKYDRINADLDERAELIKSVQAAEAREAEIANSMRGLEDVARPVESRTAAPQQSDADIIREIVTGERRGHVFGIESRDLLKSTSNAPVPITFSSQVIDQARLVGPMLDPSVVTVLTTSAGEDLVLPSLATFSTAVIKGEAAAIDESDPSFGKTTLKAYKYSFLLQLSSEFLTDSNIDVLGFVARQAGNEFGVRINNALTVGTGTVEPTGIAHAASAGITGGTATATLGTGAFTADNLIDLVYSLDGAARRLPGFGIMANGSSIGAMRKLKTTQGDYIFTPTLDAETPDRVLGFPLVENPAIASIGSGARSVLAGHFPSYYVRSVGGLQVARSDDYAFANDLVTLRFTWRVDGALPQTSHVKRFTGGTA
jgi:HK97 family phage major capsid protein